MEPKTSKVTTAICDRRTFGSLMLKRTAWTVLGAIAARSLFRPKPMAANGLLKGTIVYDQNTLICDCTSASPACGCIVQN
jgi:hypothetical protein